MLIKIYNYCAQAYLYHFVIFRIHLFTLLFEECKLMCAKIVEDVGVVTVMNR